MAAARQGLPVRLDRARQRGAAFTLTRASRRARTLGTADCCARAASGHVAAAPARLPIRRFRFRQTPGALERTSITDDRENPRERECRALVVSAAVPDLPGHSHLYTYRVMAPMVLAAK
jgi:hypothetical protein